MNFVAMGIDEPAAAFLQAAKSAGDRLLAFVEIPSDMSFSDATIPRLRALEDLGGKPYDAIVVAGRAKERADLLRLLSRLNPPGLVVSTPVAIKPDVYYELALTRSEDRFRVLPLMPELFHPGLARIREHLSGVEPSDIRSLKVEASIEPTREGPGRFMTGWIWPRAIGGEIVSVSATGSGDDPSQLDEVLASARFQSGRLAVIAFRRGAIPTIAIEWSEGRLEARLPGGFEGPTEIRWKGAKGGGDETIPCSSFGERMLAAWRALGPDDGEPWLAATRQVELSEAVERSLKYERAVSLTYDEFTESAGFKSIMAATGCGLIWGIVLVAILAAAGVPYIQYIVLPVLLAFLGLQYFGLAYRKRERTAATPPPS